MGTHMGSAVVKNNAAGGKEIIRGIMRKPVGRAGKR